MMMMMMMMMMMEHEGIAFVRKVEICLPSPSPATQRHVAEGLYPQLHHCDNIVI
jgi:hypothetical protein